MARRAVQAPGSRCQVSNDRTNRGGRGAICRTLLWCKRNSQFFGRRLCLHPPEREASNAQATFDSPGHAGATGTFWVAFYIDRGLRPGGRRGSSCRNGARFVARRSRIGRAARSWVRFSGERRRGRDAEEGRPSSLSRPRLARFSTILVRALRDHPIQSVHQRPGRIRELPRE